VGAPEEYAWAEVIKMKYVVVLTSLEEHPVSETEVGDPTPEVGAVRLCADKEEVAAVLAARDDSQDWAVFEVLSDGRAAARRSITFVGDGRGTISEIF
jgi:hypothetical protein